MENQTFYKQFAIVNGIAGMMVLGIYFIPKLSQHLVLGIFTMIFFALFVLASFILGKKSAASENKNDFTRLIISLIFAKFGLCILAVVAFDKIMVPTDNLYLIPFFALYLLYSFFEFKVLSLLGYQK